MTQFKKYLTEQKISIPTWDILRKNNKMLSTAVRLLKRIESLNGEALIVGGSVRDIIMGNEPNDIDIATNVPLEKIKQYFKWNDIGMSDKFGITMIHYGDYEFEVANYREDSAKSDDNRRPNSINLTNTFKDDSSRRDFTINSMGLNSKGEIVDYHNGIDDINNGIIKTVGEPKSRFMEDGLRILRALRFASKYGFKLDKETQNAIKQFNYLIDNISPERITQELFKVASNGKQLANYIRYLDESGILKNILPEIKKLQNKTQNPLYHPEGDAYDHTLKALEISRSDNPITNIAIALHDIGKGLGATGSKDGYYSYHNHDTAGSNLIPDIGKRLRLPNKIINTLVYTTANHMKMHLLDRMKNKKLVALLSSPYWGILKDVAYADNFSRTSNENKGEGLTTPSDFDTLINNTEERVKSITINTNDNNTSSFIKGKVNGDLIMKLTGLKPSKDVGIILNATEDWLYDNINATKDEINDFIMNEYNKIKVKNTYDNVFMTNNEK